MTRLLIIILIIIVLGYLWYQWQARKAAEQEQARQRQLTARGETERAPLPPLANVAAPSLDGGVRASAERASAEGSALLQDAADTAAGLDLERATVEMKRTSAELSEARREADLAAARLADKADDTLAEVRAAADLDAGIDADFVRDDIVAVDDSGVEIIEVDSMLLRDRDADDRSDIVAEAIAAADAGSVPPGAIRGDGGRVCPPTYPIKGNEQAMLYHTPENATYQATVPELCFSTVEAARAAGYAEAKH